MCQPMPDLKKQFNRTSQYLTEKVGGVKDDAELDEEYFELVRKVAAVEDSTVKIKRRLKEYMQPNSSVRATLAVQTCLFNVRGQTGTLETKYLEPEFKLANILLKAGNGLSSVGASTRNNNKDDEVPSKYASAFLRMSEAFTTLSDLKENMIEEARVTLLAPLYDMQEKHLKNISFLRKKLETRHLDYKYKKGQGDKIPDEELQTAKDKFEMSKEACVTSMACFIEIDEKNQVDMLRAFADNVRRYHRDCADVMAVVRDLLQSDMFQEPNPGKEMEKVCVGEVEKGAKKRAESNVSNQSEVLERSSSQMSRVERSYSQNSQQSNKKRFSQQSFNNTTIRYTDNGTVCGDEVEKETKERVELYISEGDVTLERSNSQMSNRSHNLERSYSQTSQQSNKKRFSQQFFNNTTVKYTNDAYASDDFNTSLPSMVV